jgi:hypothetical protein
MIDPLVIMSGGFCVEGILFPCVVLFFPFTQHAIYTIWSKFKLALHDFLPVRRKELYHSFSSCSGMNTSQYRFPAG